MTTAVVVLEEDGLWLYGDEHVGGMLAREHGGQWHAVRDCWVLPAAALAAVTDRLDQLGVVWACERHGPPRHWAQWLFAELPWELHDRVYDALFEILDGGGHELHRELLMMAWADRPPR